MEDAAPLQRSVRLPADVAGRINARLAELRRTRDPGLTWTSLVRELLVRGLDHPSGDKENDDAHA